MKRTITPAELSNDAPHALLLDVRREADYAASGEKLPNSVWRDPQAVDSWIADAQSRAQVVVYCVRGGSVSNSVVDRLQAAGINACYLEGGMEGWKASGGKVETK